MALFLHLFGADVPEHVVDEIQETGKGKLEILYGNAMQASKAALDAEAERGLLSPASPDSPKAGPSTQGFEQPLEDVEKAEVQEPLPRRKRNSVRDSQSYVAGSPQNDGPAEEMDYYSTTDPDCYNHHGQPVRKPRWRPLRHEEGDTPISDADEELEANEDESEVEEEDEDEESLSPLDLENPWSARKRTTLAKSPRLPRVLAARQRLGARPDEPRQAGMQRSRNVTQMQMGQATLEELPPPEVAKAVDDAKGFGYIQPICICDSMRHCSEMLRNLPCCEGTRHGNLDPQAVEQGLLGKLYHVSRKRQVKPMQFMQRAS
mmetsp:Transcript_40122/g.74811  ORF Transcript_40122/g.74811 Transcript_40122/m.74811 type:complete len:319 (+) Transcript_40122:82-1038(+)